MQDFHLLVYGGKTLTGVQETLLNLEAAPVTVLLDIPTYELPPQEFSIYLQERDKGAVFSTGAQLSYTTQASPCVLLCAGDRISPTVLQYIKYFFEDSECPLVFVPVLNNNEVMPPELLNLPPGGVVNDISLLARYNFICATTNPSLLQGGSTIQSAMVCAAVREGHFGVLTAVACAGSRGISRDFSAAELHSIIEKNSTNEAVRGFIHDYVLKQAALPLKDSDSQIELLSPYTDTSIFENKQNTTIQINSITNYYSHVEVEGYYAPALKDTNFTITSNTEILHFETQRVIETVADKFIPRFSFACKASLAANKTKLTFKQNRRNIISDEFSFVENYTRNYTVTMNKNAMEIQRIAMRPHYKISCIIPVYNAEAYLAEAIESIIKQDLDFYPNIQIVLVNDGSTDSGHNICEEFSRKYEYNIVYVKQKNKGVSAARNAGLRHAMGNYIFFMDADDTIDANMLQLGVKHLDDKKNGNIDFIAFPSKKFGTEDAQATDLEFRFSENGIINLKDNPEKIQFSAWGVVMRAKAIENVLFDESLTFTEDAEFMCRAMAEKQQYMVCKDAFYNYRILPGKYSNNTGQYGGTAHFASALAAFFTEKYNEVAPYAQHVILYDITRALNNDPLRTVFANTGEAIAQISKALGYVQDEFIVNIRNLSRHLQEYLLYLKHAGEPRILHDGFYSGEYRLGNFTADVFIDYVRERENNLCINGYLYLPTYNNVVLAAKYAEQEYHAGFSIDERKTVLIFGQTVHCARAFEIQIPLAAVQNGEAILFQIKHGNNCAPVTLHLPEKFLFIGKSVIALPANEGIQTLLFDYGKLPPLLSNVIDSNEVINEYLTLHQFLGKSRIWLFVNPSCGVEKNALTYLYEYCSSKQDGVEKYLALSEQDAELYGENTVVTYGSRSFAVLAMLAEKIIVSDLPVLCKLKNSLTAAEFVFVPQDILTIADTYKLKTLAGAPIKIIALTSEEEINLLPAGEIRDRAIITGNPKYDAITDNRQPRILFMPNYRKHLYHGKNKFNPQFASSEYATRISDILLEERFLDAADALGIHVDFAPHEKTYLQLSDFEMDDSVTVIPPVVPRSELCQNAKLLITDTLPAYGFARLGKPVIYFNFDSDGTLPQDGARFGDSTNDLNKLVDLLIEYMQNNFEIKPEHSAEGEKFFTNKDKLSSERIHVQMIGE